MSEGASTTASASPAPRHAGAGRDERLALLILGAAATVVAAVVARPPAARVLIEDRDTVLDSGGQAIATSAPPGYQQIDLVRTHPGASA